MEASIYVDNPEWSVDEEVAGDIQLIDAVAEKEAHIFIEECKLFPADVQIQSIYPLPDVSDLEKQLSDQSNRLLSLQELVDDLASKMRITRNLKHNCRNIWKLFLKLQDLLTQFTPRKSVPGHVMEEPHLHGFGPSANRLLEAYKTLLKFLGNLKNLQDSHAAVAAGSSETVAAKPSTECGSALTFLNREFGILSASIALEKGEEVN
ncbi:AUGMIN subunit 7 [Olea europaea subsp. europaea]|uniref:AUGMIN subunit 7 n=1 Tax=Olea europaea subsp. europaea TaxID=158383 RepID=A0A8S0Q8C0_OLEEU|nr:AUGMIN subunit 7 [Olea europaea subsp. europaea]